MIAWYGRKGRNEEILLVPDNFYLYASGHQIAFSIDPDELKGVNRLLRNPPKSNGLELINWSVERVEIPDFRIKRLIDLCFSGASDSTVFHRIMGIYNYAMRELDRVSGDSG